MTADPAQKTSSRRKRLLLWLLLAACVVGAVCMAGLYLSRRGLAARFARHQLEAIGAQGVDFRVATLDGGQTRIQSISLPGGGVRIASAGAFYSPFGLLGLRLQEASVQGAEVEVQRTRDGWRVPVVDWVMGLQLPPSDPDKPKSFYVQLPTATLDGAVRLAHHELADWRLPLELSAEVLPNMAKATGTLHVLADTATVEAEISPDLTGDVRVHGGLSDLSAVHTIARYADMPLPVELLPGGSAKASASVKLVEGKPTAATAELAVAGSRCRWRDQEIGLGKMRVAVQTKDGGMAEWQAQTSVEGLGGFGAVISELQLTASGRVAAGETELTICRFRRGALSGEFSGGLRWYDGGRVQGDLRIKELCLGTLVIRDAALSVEGVAAALDWRLVWHDEAGVYGLRSLELAGRASLAGDPETTIAGTATLDLGTAAKAAGLPGWAGEATVTIQRESAVRLGSAGANWGLNVAGGCPQITGAVGESKLEVKGTEAELRASGTADTVDARLTISSPTCLVSHSGVQLGAKGFGLVASVSKLAFADVVSLARSPRSPLPTGSQATVTARAKLDRCDADLSQVAEMVEHGGLLGGSLSIQEAGAELRWGANEVRVDSSLAGECPDLVIQPTRGVRVSAPAKFRLKATGTPNALSCDGNAEGEGLAIGRGEALAQVGAWNGRVSATGITPAGIAALPARLSDGWKLPDGMAVDGSLSLSGTELDVGPWMASTTGWKAGGKVAMDSAKADIRGDKRGLSGTLDLSGGGKELYVESPQAGRVGGGMDFAVGLGGTPTGVSGSVRLGVTEPNWRRGKSGARADKLQVSVGLRNVAPNELMSLARDPLALGSEDTRDRISLRLGLENGSVVGVADAISLGADGILWSPARGWQTAPEGVQLRIGEAGVQGVKAKDVEAVAHVAGQQLKTSAKLPLVGPGVTASIEATAQLGPRLSAKGALTVPEFSLSTDQGWVLGLGLFGDTEFSGKVSASADVRWNGQESAAHLDFALRDGNVVLPNNTGGIEGLAVKVRLDASPTVSTPAHQSLQFSKASFGPVRFTEGRALFQLIDPTRLFVEEAHAGWCGGTLDTYALRFNTAKTNVGAVVYARDVDVGEFIKLLPNVKGTGQGKLYGRLPAFRRNGRYGYGEGFLYSIPGERGRLQLSELGPIRDAVQGMREVGIIVDSSLRNLDYSLFRVDIRPQGHENPGIRIRVLGTEAGKENAQPVDLNVNVLGAVEEALNIGMKMGAMKTLAEDLLRLNQTLQRLIE